MNDAEFAREGGLFEIRNQECVEMTCFAVSKTHFYGHPHCSYVLAADATGATQLLTKDEAALLKQKGSLR